MRFAAADAVPYAFASYIPALSAGATYLEARAKRDGRTLDLTPLRGALDDFAPVARRADDAIARGEGPGTERALAAAQAIDSLAYGVEGYASVTFPEVSRVYAIGSDAAIDAAVERARDAVRRATASLQ